MVTRTRPTMADWKKARDLEWLAENGHLVASIGTKNWFVWDEQNRDYGDEMTLFAAIALAKKQQEATPVATTIESVNSGLTTSTNQRTERTNP